MHVVRLYGMEFERPGPRLRDYVRRVQGALAAALRACRMLTESEVEEPAATDVFHGLVAAAAQHSRPVISFKSRAGTAIRRSAARSVVSGPDCDTDRRCVLRSGLGGRGEEVDVVVAAVAASHHWPRQRRRIIIGPIGLTIWGCAGRQRDPAVLTLPVTDSECGVAARRRSSAAPGDHRRPSNHWSSGQFPAHPRPALRHRATR